MSEYHRRHLDDREVQRRWLDPRISSVWVADIRAYLLHKNWKLVAPDRPGFLVFQEPAEVEGGPLYQCVPESERGRDYTRRIYELIAAIAEVEDRYAGDVLADILRPSVTPTPTNGPAVSKGAEIAAR
jgi:hypothetical protein